MANRYDKYIDLEFSYFTSDGDHRLLTYYGKFDGGGTCDHCGKELKVSHQFTAHQDNDEGWIFGNECVKHVFGAGLRKSRRNG